MYLIEYNNTFRSSPLKKKNIKTNCYIFIENNDTRNANKFQVLTVNIFFYLRRRNIKYLT